jgi:hypothetical protein
MDNKGSDSTQFKSLGLGSRNHQQSISVMYSASVDKILRSIPNRSEYIRNAVIKQLIADGLLTEDHQPVNSDQKPDSIGRKYCQCHAHSITNHRNTRTEKSGF